MLNTFYDSYSILNKVYGEGAFLKQAMISVPIEERNRSAVTKLCYGVLEKDILLSFWLKQLCPKTPKLPVRTVLKISMYSIRFLDKAPYAVTDTAVELLNKLGKKGVSGFANAVLRKFTNYKFQEPSNKTEKLSLKYDYPAFAVEKLISDYGLERAESIMSAPAEKTCVRFSNVDGEKYLIDKGVKYTKMPYNNAFFVDKFQRNADYDKGIYTFQSIGSQAICDAVHGGSSLLDACSAPGGKSVLLSEKFDSVTSQELHPHRAELIKEYAERMGIKNISVCVGDATLFNKEFEEKFDAVLCDVPCSGFGVMMSNPDIKLKKTIQTVKELNEIQLAILKNCSKYVKKGGVIYYSTCSIFKEENDNVVRKFLRDATAFMPEIINAKIPYDKTDFGVQFLPDKSFGAGFYICALKREK